MSWWEHELWAGNPLGKLGKGVPLRRPRWMPKPYWQRVTWIRGVWCALLLGAVVLPRLFTSFGIAYLALVVIAAGVLWVVCPRIAFHGLKGRLVENDCLMCLSCGYPLRGLPARHVCPECGWAYDAEKVQGAWRYWLDVRKLPRDVFT